MSMRGAFLGWSEKYGGYGNEKSAFEAGWHAAQQLAEPPVTSTNNETLRCAECRWWDEECYAWWGGCRPCNAVPRTGSECFVGGGDNNDNLYTGPEFFCKNFERQVDNAKPKGENNGRNG